MVVAHAFLWFAHMLPCGVQASSSLVPAEPDFEKALADERKFLTEFFKARESVKRVYWQKKQGRFRVTFKDPLKGQQWFSVKKLSSLVKGSASSLEDLRRAMSRIMDDGMQQL